ncbi:hypothetical protein DQ04_00281050 [Trypanosoma grayi]|uniref:hypothetical protein n=1 Tax=Trypanosoma grayi TaxID=71804 RepID=UPI0004F49087|nr:hypothetical protein DQ04_00281050 [Trypanosoma grayi]KEG14842.1 hypothetical protein DQ04_00281050 [Trypanosoma grayi]
MAKKHRVKRQKYVEHLLRLEKEREAYLEKRTRPKRSREERNDGERFAEVDESRMGGDKKRGRTEKPLDEEVPAVTPVPHSEGSGAGASTLFKEEKSGTEGKAAGASHATTTTTTTTTTKTTATTTAKRLKRRY